MLISVISDIHNTGRPVLCAREVSNNGKWYLFCTAEIVTWPILCSGTVNFAAQTRVCLATATQLFRNSGKLRETHLALNPEPDAYFLDLKLGGQWISV